MHIMQKFTCRIICWYIVLLDQSATWSKLDPKFASQIGQMIKMIQVTNFSRLGMVRFPFQLDTLLAIVYTTHWSTGHRSNLGHQLAQIRVLENRHKFTIHIFPFNKYIKNAMQIGVDNYDQLYD